MQWTHWSLVGPALYILIWTQVFFKLGDYLIHSNGHYKTPSTICLDLCNCAVTVARPGLKFMWIFLRTLQFSIGVVATAWIEALFCWFLKSFHPLIIWSYLCGNNPFFALRTDIFHKLQLLRYYSQRETEWVLLGHHRDMMRQHLLTSHPGGRRVPVSPQSGCSSAPKQCGFVANLNTFFFLSLAPSLYPWQTAPYTITPLNVGKDILKNTMISLWKWWESNSGSCKECEFWLPHPLTQKFRFESYHIFYDLCWVCIVLIT